VRADELLTSRIGPRIGCPLSMSFNLSYIHILVMWHPLLKGLALNCTVALMRDFDILRRDLPKTARLD